MDDTDENNIMVDIGIPINLASMARRPDTLGPRTALNVVGVCFKKSLSCGRCNFTYKYSEGNGKSNSYTSTYVWRVFAACIFAVCISLLVYIAYAYFDDYKDMHAINSPSVRDWLEGLTLKTPAACIMPIGGA